jgi:1,4-dihydroxy-2-naphthoate octaprenyltransferase
VRWRLAEAFIFAFASIAYIWVRPLWWSWSLLIPLAMVVVSFVWHSETAESLGMSLRAFVRLPHGDGTWQAASLP